MKSITTIKTPAPPTIHKATKPHQIERKINQSGKNIPTPKPISKNNDFINMYSLRFILSLLPI